MTVIYEWDVETVADGDTTDFEDGEVIDHYHVTSYKEAASYVRDNKADDGFRFEVVLVRDDDEGRSWAYLGDGKLPEFFTDADGADDAKVPQKFVREVAKA